MGQGPSGEAPHAQDVTAGGSAARSVQDQMPEKDDADGSSSQFEGNERDRYIGTKRRGNEISIVGVL